MYSGPHIKRDGLVFGYDTGYSATGKNLSKGRYFKGPASSNILEVLNHSISNTSGANGFVLNGEETVNIPKVGKRSVKYVEYYNNHSNAGSLGCCPNLFYYHDGYITGVESSTPYTYSIIYKHTGGYTHPNFMYRYEHNSSGTTLTEGGLHSTASDRRRHLGNGWYHAWGTFTTLSTTTQLRCYSFLYNYGTTKHKFYVAAISLVKNTSGSTHLIIPPQLMLKPNTSISSTQSLIDLTKTTNIDVSNVSFDSNGLPTFDGTDDLIAVNPGTFPSSWSQPFTLEAIVYIPSSATWYRQGSGLGIVGRGSYTGSWGLMRGSGNNTVYFYIRTGGNTFNPGGTIGRDKYYHILGTWNGSNQAIFYINGNQNSQETSSNVGSTVDNTGNMHIGGNIAFGGSNGGYGEGTYPVIKLYNRALSPKEVKQNFRAYKNRFNI